MLTSLDPHSLSRRSTTPTSRRYLRRVGGRASRSPRKRASSRWPRHRRHPPTRQASRPTIKHHRAGPAGSACRRRRRRRCAARSAKIKLTVIRDASDPLDFELARACCHARRALSMEGDVGVLRLSASPNRPCRHRRRSTTSTRRGRGAHGPHPRSPQQSGRPVDQAVHVRRLQAGRGGPDPRPLEQEAPT